LEDGRILIERYYLLGGNCLDSITIGAVKLGAHVKRLFEEKSARHNVFTNIVRILFPQTTAESQLMSVSGKMATYAPAFDPAWCSTRFTPSLNPGSQYYKVTLNYLKALDMFSLGAQKVNDMIAELAEHNRNLVHQVSLKA
jgi:hypothetical protein